MTDPKRIALFVSFSGQGGVERMMGNLARGLVDAGFAVDMVLVKAKGEHLKSIPPQVRVVELGASHTSTSLIGLMRYLRKERPAALIAAKDRAIKVAVLARALTGVDFTLVGRIGTTVSAALKGRGALRQWLWYSGMRLFYRHTDRIVAVSEGVAADIRRITGLSADRVRVVRNPVWTPDILERARRPVDHPWLNDATVPVILGAGRLTRQKDFPTLLRAFARVRETRPCRLIILGDGQQRALLEALAAELGVADSVSLPGFQANPYPYLARASLFVLSSAWEGSPNVLTEALALGVPAVATDCPSGPREILAEGRYGTLCPVGDMEALARAMEETLRNPLPPETLRDAVRVYTIAAGTAGYLDALGLAAPSATPAHT